MGFMDKVKAQAEIGLAKASEATKAGQEKLDQANKDVKKAWDALDQKASAYMSNQKAVDDARRQVAGLKQQIERLQNSIKDAEKNAKAAMDKAVKASNDEAEKLKAQIAELKARLEEKGSIPAPPVQPTTTTPTTSAPAPAGK